MTTFLNSRQCAQAPPSNGSGCSSFITAVEQTCILAAFRPLGAGWAPGPQTVTTGSAPWTPIILDRTSITLTLATRGESGKVWGQSRLVRWEDRSKGPHERRRAARAPVFLLGPLDGSWCYTDPLRPLQTFQATGGTKRLGLEVPGELSREDGMQGLRTEAERGSRRRRLRGPLRRDRVCCRVHAPAQSGCPRDEGRRSSSSATNAKTDHGSPLPLRRSTDDLMKLGRNSESFPCGLNPRTMLPSARLLARVPGHRASLHVVTCFACLSPGADIDMEARSPGLSTDGDTGDSPFS